MVVGTIFAKPVPAPSMGQHSTHLPLLIILFKKNVFQQSSGLSMAWHILCWRMSSTLTSIFKTLRCFIVSLSPSCIHIDDPQTWRYEYKCSTENKKDFVDSMGLSMAWHILCWRVSCTLIVIFKTLQHFIVSLSQSYIHIRCSMDMDL